MKAVVYTHYGSPDVLQFTDLATPVPADDEVLIQVHAAAANPADWHLMRGEPFLARFANGLLNPKNTRLGADVVGRIAGVGSNVTQLQVGDAVFGCLPVTALGSFAEYVCAAEALVAVKPANITFEQAAAVPLAAFTALQGLHNAGQIQSGQTVLINGASGGVGTFAVQLANAFGTDVTGVCSTRNVDLVRSIGATHVIDYTQADFTKTGQHYDLIFDAVGNRSVADYQRALRPNGRCVVAGFTTLTRLFQVLVLGAWASRTGSQNIGLMETAKPNQNDLALLKQLLEAGTVVPVIDRCYPFREVPEAIRYLEAGHARGKVIITVEPTNRP